MSSFLFGRKSSVLLLRGAAMSQARRSGSVVARLPGCAAWGCTAGGLGWGLSGCCAAACRLTGDHPLTAAPLRIGSFEEVVHTDIDAVKVVDFRLLQEEAPSYPKLELTLQYIKCSSLSFHPFPIHVQRIRRHPAAPEAPMTSACHASESAPPPRT